MRFLTPVLLAAALAAPPLLARDKDPEAELAKMLAGRTPDKPTDCIPLYRTMSSTTIDRTALVYEQGRTLYVNRFEGQCTLLDWTHIPVTKTPTGQLCRGDIVRMVDRTSGFMTGSCAFGPFQPYTKAK